MESPRRIIQNPPTTCDFTGSSPSYPPPLSPPCQPHSEQKAKTKNPKVDFVFQRRLCDPVTEMVQTHSRLTFASNSCDKREFPRRALRKSRLLLMSFDGLDSLTGSDTRSHGRERPIRGLRSALSRSPALAPAPPLSLQRHFCLVTSLRL